MLILLIEEYKNINEDKYTKESFAEFIEVLNIATNLLNEDNVTEDEVNNIISLLKDKYNSLNEINNEDEIEKPEDDESHKNDNEISKPDGNESGSDGSDIKDESNKEQVEIKANINNENDGGNDELQGLPVTGEILNSQFIVLLGVLSLIVGIVSVKNNKKFI